MGAPLVTLRAPGRNDDPEAWGEFVATFRPLVARGKESNVVIAVRNDPATLCAAGADLKHLAKDIDSAWLRFALDIAALGTVDVTDELVRRTVLAYHDVTDVADFARNGDPEAARIAARLNGFRGFVVVDRADTRGDRAAFHAALARLRATFARTILGGSP